MCDFFSKYPTSGIWTPALGTGAAGRSHWQVHSPLLTMQRSPLWAGPDTHLPLGQTVPVTGEDRSREARWGRSRKWHENLSRAAARGMSCGAIRGGGNSTGKGPGAGST